MNTPTETPVFKINRELVRPDLDDSDIRFTVLIGDQEMAEATARPARDDNHPRGAYPARLSWKSYSDHSVVRAQAHVVAVNAALAELGVTER